MFREYDRLFAQALGLEINQGTDYEITNVLSQDWWDDRAWDLKLSN